MRLCFLGAALIIIVLALLFQQGFFTFAPAQESAQMLFLDVSRADGITHNRQGIKKKGFHHHADSNARMGQTCCFLSDFS